MEAQDALKLIESKLPEVRNSDRFREFLATMAKFHRYSYYNTMLIMYQNPAATNVAGFSAWIKNFKRRVNTGEKGISILAPILVNENDKNGQVKQYLKGFRSVYVFDINQTQGEPLPTIANELQGDDAGLYGRLYKVAESEGIKVHVAHLTGGIKGYYDKNQKVIVVKADMSALQMAKTAAHELGHHFAKHQENHHNNVESETIAESVAFVVLSHFGLDSASYTFDYLASWTDEAIFKSKLKEIQQAAKTIIEKCSSFS